MDEYRLLQRHKVNGVWQEPGYCLSLPPQLGKWLVEQGIVERIGAPAVPVMPRVADVVPRPPVFARAATPRLKCCGWNR